MLTIRRTHARRNRLRSHRFALVSIPDVVVVALVIVVRAIALLLMVRRLLELLAHITVRLRLLARITLLVAHETLLALDRPRTKRLHIGIRTLALSHRGKVDMDRRVPLHAIKVLPVERADDEELLRRGIGNAGERLDAELDGQLELFP